MLAIEESAQPASASFVVTEIQLRDDDEVWVSSDLYIKEGKKDAECQEEPADANILDLDYNFADKELLEQMAALGLPSSFGTSFEATKRRKDKKVKDAIRRKDRKGKAVNLRLKEPNGSDATDHEKDHELRSLDAQEQGFTESNSAVHYSNSEDAQNASWRPLWDQFYQRYYFCNLRTLETSWEPPEGLEHYALYPAEGKLEGEVKLEAVSTPSLEWTSCTEILDLENGKSRVLKTLPGLLACDVGKIDGDSMGVELGIEFKNCIDLESTTEARTVGTIVDNASTSFDISSTLSLSRSLAERGLCNAGNKSKKNADDLTFEDCVEYSLLEKFKPLKTKQKISDLENISMECEAALALEEDQRGIESEEVARHTPSNLPAWCGSHLRFENDDHNVLKAEICGTESNAKQKSDQNNLFDTQPGPFATALSETAGSLKIKTRCRKEKQLHVFKTEKVLLPGMFEALNKDLVKYWHQRYRLFSRFDEGIKMDDEAWFSVTPEIIARHHACRCANNVVVDAFVGVGGNAIQFALRGNYVIAIDIDPKKIDYCKHNAEIYGVANRIEFVVGDFFKVAPSLKADVVFLSPPWGGPTYMNVDKYDLQTMMQPRDGFTVFKIVHDIAPSVIFFLPRNVDPSQPAEMSWLFSPPLACEVENNYINGKLKAITAYYGSIAIVQDS
ncbi:hypothetical protein O6H91_04G083500 [Diphasiastrum complanatum]|uniref:Uncharacterized protein n=3 Tax=Diphasiastrum complanatum TaxID=34168 RepID=A0ACC2DZ73_DIPCM|nr:hypothetical protein O6H91_04G083500 [Diphasiastrum complanatum]KAJ7559400.1 hypothetical protein O6H91_04G083500 [Diphasiastrum complanatum]KAJ7559402.1 hypothetical protein O6H91_04G083500 [Diphasiastrum complanatum]